MEGPYRAMPEKPASAVITVAIFCYKVYFGTHFLNESSLSKRSLPVDMVKFSLISYFVKSCSGNYLAALLTPFWKILLREADAIFQF